MDAWQAATEEEDCCQWLLKVIKNPKHELNLYSLNMNATDGKREVEKRKESRNPKAFHVGVPNIPKYFQMTFLEILPSDPVPNWTLAMGTKKDFLF